MPNSKHPASKSIAIDVSAMVAAPGRVQRVELLLDGNLAATASSPPFALMLAMPSIGQHELVARAVAEDQAVALSPPIGISVVAPPTVSLGGPPAGVVLAAGTSVRLEASAASAGASIAKVEFHDGTTPLGVATAAPFALPAVVLMQGQRLLTATAVDELGQRTTSPAVTFAIAPPKRFIESAGVVAFEAEDFESADPHGDIPWVVQTTASGYAGAGYVVCASDSFSYKNANEPSAELTYSVELAASGTYHLYARRWFPNNGADSIFYRFGTGAVLQHDGTNSSFDWSYLGAVSVPAAGAHKLTLKRRETNARIDRFVISRAMQMPAGVGPNVSAKAP